jgi:hypothetical protein
MSRIRVLRLGRILLGVCLAVLLLPTVVYAQAPEDLAGTGYSVGDTAYDFTGPDENMNPVSLYQYYGRYTILAYDAAWCGPSNVNAMYLSTAVSELAADGIPVNALTVLIDGRTEGITSTQTDATYWNIRYKLSPVIHMNGAYDPIIFAQFLAYSVPNGGAPDGAFPTLVILNPHMEIVKEQVSLMYPDQFEQVILDDLKSNLVELKSMVEDMDLKPSLSNSLSSKVNDALTALEGTDYEQVNNELVDFMGKVTNKTGEGLTTEQAAILANQVDLIQAGLGY